MRTGGFVLLVAAAVVAAVAANFVLLGYGRKSDDPVGHLTPRVVEVMARGGGEPATRPSTPSRVDDDHGDGDEDD
jgi:hypothetical protein